MIGEIKRNIEIELLMIQEISDYLERYEVTRGDERNLFGSVANSLQRRIKILNKSVGQLTNNVSLTKKLHPKIEKETGVDKVEVEGKFNGVAISREDKEKFMQELSLEESLINQLKRRENKKSKVKKHKESARLYAKFANKIFFDYSNKLVNEKPYFNSMRRDLVRSNLNILTTTYVSMMLLSMVVALVVGVFAMMFLIFFKVGIAFPFVSVYEGSYLLRGLQVFWVAITAPLLVGGLYYFYPLGERKSAAKKIDQELPFVVIYMSSISGSGIEPTQIFKIIGKSEEYKSTRGEIRKLLNQVNVHGYDLVTALKNVAASSPSQKMAELLNGLAATLKTGGDLQGYFDKRAESLLLNYKLEREKFSKTTETFMDIYISVVIATPMILLMLLIMISISGIGLALGIVELSIAIIGLVAVVNVVFLGVLAIKQPGY